MTKTSTRMELSRLQSLHASEALPLLFDEKDMIVFLRENEAFCDHVFWYGVEDAAGNWSVEQSIDFKQGTCDRRRVWLTPKEHAKRKQETDNE